jgi:hypothetical protein
MSPLQWGGDMDDPHNPASPFVSREAAEEQAAAQMGIDLDREREAQNAAEISFVDQYIGIKFDDDPNPALARAVAFNKDAMHTMLGAAEEIRQLIPQLPLGVAARLNLVEQDLRNKIPSWYGTGVAPRGG